MQAALEEDDGGARSAACRRCRRETGRRERGVGARKRRRVGAQSVARRRSGVGAARVRQRRGDSGVAAAERRTGAVIGATVSRGGRNTVTLTCGPTEGLSENKTGGPSNPKHRKIRWC